MVFLVFMSFVKLLLLVQPVHPYHMFPVWLKPDILWFCTDGLGSLAPRGWLESTQYHREVHTSLFFSAQNSHLAQWWYQCGFSLTDCSLSLLKTIASLDEFYVIVDKEGHA